MSPILFLILLAAGIVLVLYLFKQVTSGLPFTLLSIAAIVIFIILTLRTLHIAAI